MARKLATPNLDLSQSDKGNAVPRQARTPLADRVSSVPNAHVPASPTTEGRREVVFVACKLSVAWFEMQCCEAQEVWEQGLQGGRKTEVNLHVGEIKRIRGTAQPVGLIPRGMPPAPVMRHGYVITPNFDKSFWDTWVHQYHLFPAVVNGLIMADKDLARLTARCKERADLMSGLEPLVPGTDDEPTKDPRVPKPIRAELTDLETEETRAAKMRRGEFAPVNEQVE